MSLDGKPSPAQVQSAEMMDMYINDLLTVIADLRARKSRTRGVERHYMTFEAALACMKTRRRDILNGCETPIVPHVVRLDSDAICHEGFKPPASMKGLKWINQL